MITLDSCPACESKDIGQYDKLGTAPMVKYEIMPGVKVKATIISHYYVCRSCSVIFQNPRLSDSELDDFYKKGFYRRSVNLTDEEIDDDEISRAKVDADIILKHADQPHSHLDVGGGNGYLLGVIGADEKVLVEPNVDIAKVEGIEVYPEMIKVPKKKFDLVSAIHVLEHVSNPLEFLQEMAKFVKKDGFLVIEVPTWKSPGGPLRFAHLYHFETDVLKLLCLRAGLEVKQIEFTPHLLLICQIR